MPGATSGPLTTTGGTPAASASAFAVTGTPLSPAQQGPKLVGTGAVGPLIYQGYSVALSADGTTLATGGPYDNGGAGATWVFSAFSGPLAPRPAAGPRAAARFFPNPVADQLTPTGGPPTGPLRLFDGTGRTLRTGTYRDGQPVDLSTLPPGLYWLQLDQQAPQPLLKR